MRLKYDELENMNRIARVVGCVIRLTAINKLAKTS